MNRRLLAPVVVLALLLAARTASALTIEITNDKTPVMVGSKTVAMVSQGQTYVVEKQKGVWYGIRVRAGGSVLFGWVHSSNCKEKRATTGVDPVEAAAEKEFLTRKAQADKLAADGKFSEAIALLDKFPTRYWKTKAGKKAMEYAVDLEKKATAKPEFVEKQAEEEFKKAKAKADKLAADGKLNDAVRALEQFAGGRHEKTKWAEEARQHILELQKRAHAPLEDLEKKIWALVQEGKFDDALAEVKAAEDNGANASYIKTTRAFIELHKRGDAKPDAPVSGDDAAADVYATDNAYRKQLMSLLQIIAPGGATEIKRQYGPRSVTIQIPKPAAQIAGGEKLIASYPWSPNLRMLLARLYAREKNVAKALEHYDMARALDRGRSIVTLDSCIEAARLLTGEKRYDEAIAVGKKALERKADDFIALSVVGRAHLAAGEKAGAVRVWEKSLKINPVQPQIRRLLAEAKGETAAEPKPESLKLPDLVKKVEESCVVILAGRGSGSGFVVRADGLISTNFHVVFGALAGGGKLQVRTKRKGEFITIPNVQIVLGDPARDVALLKIDARAFPLHPLPLGDAKTVVPGQDVVVIGNPGMGGKILDYTITRGIVSNRDRVIQGAHFFQTDAAVNPGNSGGPMFNMQGQVIGMVTLKVLVMERAGFALHIDQVLAHFPRCFPISE